MTDHLAAAREALDDARGTGSAAAAAQYLASAQVHATLALAEEARTANLLRSLDYGALNRPADRGPDERRAEITARLWPAS